MTSRQRQCLLFIQKYIAEHGVPPTYDLIRTSLGIESRGAVFRYLHCLVERGHISVTKGLSRSIKVVTPIVEGEFFVFDDQAKTLIPFVRASLTRGAA